MNTYTMSQLIALFEECSGDMPEQSKVDFYVGLINLFEEQDCDTLDECFGTSNFYDMAYQQIHPNYKHWQDN